LALARFSIAREVILTSNKARPALHLLLALGILGLKYDLYIKLWLAKLALVKGINITLVKH
jgi:hypothetical protein